MKQWSKKRARQGKKKRGIRARLRRTDDYTITVTHPSCSQNTGLTTTMTTEQCTSTNLALSQPCWCSTVHVRGAVCPRNWASGCVSLTCLPPQGINPTPFHPGLHPSKSKSLRHHCFPGMSGLHWLGQPPVPLKTLMTRWSPPTSICVHIIPSKTVTTFPNNKPWVRKKLKKIINRSKCIFFSVSERWKK